MNVGKLVRVSLRDVWAHEAHDVTRWLEDNVEILGETSNKKHPHYHPHDDRGPLLLQEFRTAVRYRNIWIRELAD